MSHNPTATTAPPARDQLDPRRCLLEQNPSSSLSAPFFSSPFAQAKISNSERRERRRRKKTLQLHSHSKLKFVLLPLLFEPRRHRRELNKLHRWWEARTRSRAAVHPAAASLLRSTPGGDVSGQQLPPTHTQTHTTTSVETARPELSLRDST